jgi:hypothetical protein
MLQMADGKLCLRGEVLTADGVGELRPSWEALCARSVEDNVYYSPRYALALLGTVEKHSNVRFATVWDQKHLVALLPFTTAHFPIPSSALPARHGRASTPSAACRSWTGRWPPRRQARCLT